ncbi:DUF6169 family protein [Flavobacterium aurantiibacter]|uniref:Uncharacterized protein n=1 Tax=Flavobacterium aurantiibacter TaxID=2023067 RepID=A0A255ZMZ8_9FLAO|nr:DUF6169 family protein [Flavobacterium aurantiibacter]OYQ42937.1 hypothetical protein CHX27_11230 [Flavobacterium aurantiibacter]
MPSPYNYHFNEIAQSYIFTTVNGIEYKVAFILDYTFSAVSNIEIDHIYQLIIEKTTDAKEPLDRNVSATICALLSTFFDNERNTILYICDDGDQRAEVRFRKFNIWYAESELTDIVTKVDNVIVSENIAGSVKIYSSLLYHNENTNKETILDIYHSIEQILSEKP